MQGKPKAQPLRGLQQIRESVMALGTVVLLLIALGGASPAAGQEGAQESAWTLLLEPMYMDAFGHDQQVLTIREVDLDATPEVTTGDAVALNTKAGLAYRFGLERARDGGWDLGLDVFWFSTSQGRPARRAAAGGAVDRVIFEVADAAFESNGPDEQLSFGVLTDTDIAAWTADVYALKTLAEMSNSRLRLLLGIRNADFDNDFHAVAGIEDVGGSLFEGSSNYDRMIGPLVGFDGEISFGRNTIRAHLGQSVVFGKTELVRLIRDFSGPLADMQPVVAQRSFKRDQDVSIPITEVRINWLRSINERLSVGVAANASIWWDVSVPPGVVPAGEVSGFNKNTIVFFGLGVAVQRTFR